MLTVSLDPPPGYEPSYTEFERRSKVRWRWIVPLMFLGVAWLNLRNPALGQIQEYLWYAMIAAAIVLIPVFGYQHYKDVVRQRRSGGDERPGTSLTD